MAVIVNGDGILTGISSLATSLTDITSGRGTVTGVATVGTLQLGAGVSISSPRTQTAAIFTNNTEFFTVDDAGRVGVGTITPNSDAHPENEKKINVGFITAKSIAGDIDARNVVVAGISTFVGALNGSSATLSGQMQSASAVVTGGITATGGNIVMNDSTGSSANRIKLGTSQDLELYHTGSHSFIEHSGTGHLILGGVPNGNNVDIMKAGYSEYMARFKPDSSVDLYYDANVRFQTTPSGVDVTGTLNVTGVSTVASITGTTVTGSTLTVNDSSDADLRIQTSANNRLIIRGASSLSNIITQNNNNLSFRHDGGTGGGTEIFLMNSNGIDVANNKRIQIKDFYGDISARLENSDSTNNSFRIDVDPDASGASSAFLVRIDGNEKIRVLHGGGMTFNGDTSTANALDDYEEGTFTGGINDYNGSYTQRTGTYTKIGNVVTIQIMIQGSGHHTGSGALKLTSLPFSSEGTPSSYRAVGSVHAHTGVVSGGVQVTAMMNNNDNKVNIRTFQNNSVTTDLNRNGLNSSGWELVIGITYHTAA